MARECDFTTKDVKRVFLRNRSFYVRVFFLVFGLVFCFHLSKAPLYKATALFKQSGQVGKETEMVQTLMQNSSFAFKESGAQAILESRTLLKQVIEALALQVEVRESIWAKGVKRIRDKLYSEFGLCLPDSRRLYFSHAAFSNETPFDFFVEFVEEGVFHILDVKKRKIAQGTIGFPIALKEGTLTIQAAVDSQGLYLCRVHPWIEKIKYVRSRLEIKPSKIDKNMLSLSFSYPHAQESAAFLNELMSAYQGYLKKENEEIASLQMRYLQRRQTELTEQYEKSLEEHVSFLGSSLKDTGFMSFKQELDLLEQPNIEYMNRLYEVDLCLNRLVSKEEKKEGTRRRVQQEANPGPEEILPISLSSVLDDKRREQREVEIQYGRGHKEPSYEPLEMSPEVAQGLLAEYEKQLDALHILIEQLSHIQVALAKPHCDITSLSELLTDRICQETIQKASAIALQIEDLVNYSEKDVMRLKRDLDVKKSFLSQHIAKMLQMHRLKEHLLEEKIASLQKTSTRLLQAEKKLIQDQLDGIQEQMKSLPEKWKRESQLMMQRDLSVGMIEGLSQLAESKNIRHQLFQVESKPIDAAFSPYKTASSYLFAQCFLLAFFAVLFVFLRHFMRWLSLGRAITADSTKGKNVAFCGHLRKNGSGLLDEVSPEDKETLRRISSFIFSHKLPGVGLCATVLSFSSYLPRNIAALLSLQGLRVLVVDCTPSPINPHDAKGLYDFLGEGIAMEIMREESYDRIAPGSYKSFFVELLFRKEFVCSLEENRKVYDVILLALAATPIDASTAPLKTLADVFVVHGQDVFEEEIGHFPPLAVITDP